MRACRKSRTLLSDSCKLKEVIAENLIVCFRLPYKLRCKKAQLSDAFLFLLTFSALRHWTAIHLQWVTKRRNRLATCRHGNRQRTTPSIWFQAGSIIVSMLTGCWHSLQLHLLSKKNSLCAFLSFIGNPRRLGGSLFISLTLTLSPPCQKTELFFIQQTEWFFFNASQTQHKKADSPFSNDPTLRSCVEQVLPRLSPETSLHPLSNAGCVTPWQHSAIASQRTNFNRTKLPKNVASEMNMHTNVSVSLQFSDETLVLPLQNEENDITSNMFEKLLNDRVKHKFYHRWKPLRSWGGKMKSQLQQSIWPRLV